MFGWKILLVIAFAGPGHCIPLTGEDDKESITLQPRVSYSKDTVVKVGADAELDCAVEGLDLSNVENFRIDWSKIDEVNPVQSMPITNGDVLVYSPNGKYELNRPEGTFQYSLKINDVSEEDTGLYRCLVYFAEDQFVTPKVYLAVEKAPYFTDSSTKQVVVAEGDNVSIDCKPAGSPEPEAIWERVKQGPTYYEGSVVPSGTLELQSVAISDSGRYVCHATNGVEPPAQIEIVLTVEFAPKVSILGGSIGAEINQEFKLECRVEALPAAEISWYKGKDLILGDVNYRITEEIEEQLELDDPLQSQPQVVVSTIVVSKVSLDTLGEFSCSAENAIDTTNVTTTVSLKTPPKIEQQSARHVYYEDEKSPARSGLPASIDCKASGVPSPEYKWLKNSKPFLWESDSRFSVDPKSGSLVIEDPKFEDNGWYQCIAFNSVGVARSDPIHFSNSSRVVFDNADSVQVTLEAEEGRPFKMLCPNATSDPAPELTWVISAPPKDNRVQMEYFSSNRTVVGPNGTAYFAYVTKEDDSELNDIKYMCIGKNEFTPLDFSIGTTVTLKVKKPDDGLSNGNKDNLNIEPFLMYGSPKQTHFKGGQDNKLWCIFGGEPEPIISWSDEEGKPLEGPGYELDNFNSTLILKNTNLSHEKTYKCSGSNSVAIPNYHLMKVSVDMPPQFEEEMPPIQVEEGATVRFLCGAAGTGVLTYSWFFNGRPLVVERDVRKRTVGSELIIQPALLTDTGNYACNATSTYGYAYGQSTLNVLPNSVPNFIPSAGCPEVELMREELISVKTTLQNLRDFVKNTRTAQADASIDLIQRIAGKLDLLSEQELQLIAAQDLFRRKQNINIQTVKRTESDELEKPATLIAQQPIPNSRKPSSDLESEQDAQKETAESESVTEEGSVKDSATPEVTKQESTDPSTIAEQGISQSQSQQDSKDDSKTDVQQDSKDDSKTDVQQDSKDDSKTDVQQDSKDDSKTDIQQDTKDDSKTDGQQDSEGITVLGVSIKADAVSEESEPSESQDETTEGAQEAEAIASSTSATKRAIKGAVRTASA